MKDESLPTIAAAAATKKEIVVWSLFGRIRYKFWALAAILLLAFWSMFTGTVTLKWSAGNLTNFSGEVDSLVHDDLDILEVEDREKVVRHMWDVYTHSKTIRLPRFWQEAFEAAYEYLVSDVPEVQKQAISEIAKMSMRSIMLESSSVQSTNTQDTKKNSENSDDKGDAALSTGTAQ